MPEFITKCPHCRHEIDFTEAQSGQTINCPACALRVRLDPALARPRTAARGGSRGKGFYFAATVVLAGLIGLVWWSLSTNRSSRREAAGSLHNTNALLTAEQQVKHDYLTNMLITYLSVSRGNYGGVWEGTAVMTVKNNGDRPLSGFKLKVSLIDTNSAVLLEQSFTPMDHETNQPLMPGRSWLNDVDSALVIPGIPDNWQDGNAFAQVTDVQFLQ